MGIARSRAEGRHGEGERDKRKKVVLGKMAER